MNIANVRCHVKVMRGLNTLAVKQCYLFPRCTNTVYSTYCYIEVGINYVEVEVREQVCSSGGVALNGGLVLTAKVNLLEKNSRHG